MHVYHSLLTAVDRGERSRERLEEVLYEHLAVLCPVCAREILEAEARRSRPGITRHLEPRDPLKRLARRLGLKEVELQKHEGIARGWVRKIVKLQAEKRWQRVWGAHSNYRGPIFCHLLLKEARARIPGDPAEALSLADAVLTANRKGGGGYHADPEVRAPALAVRGNAKRALGRIGAAEEDLEEAEELLDAPGVTELATAGEVHNYLGSLRKDQGRLEEAIHHLHRAALVYDLLRDHEKAARELLALATVHYRRHDFRAASRMTSVPWSSSRKSSPTGCGPTPTTTWPITCTPPGRSTGRRRSWTPTRTFWRRRGTKSSSTWSGSGGASPGAGATSRRRSGASPRPGSAPERWRSATRRASSPWSWPWSTSPKAGPTG